MEIWIIGIPLVALMIFLSTRIKKLANEAYGEELIQRDGFALIKPEGLIALETPAEPFAFQAESKAFGETEATEGVREASASVVVENGTIRDAADSLEKIPNIEILIKTEDDCSVRFKESDGDVVLHVFKRLMNLDDRRFVELTVKVLKESIEEFEEPAKTMIRSLRRN